MLPRQGPSMGVPGQREDDMLFIHLSLVYKTPSPPTHRWPVLFTAEQELVSIILLIMKSWFKGHRA